MATELVEVELETQALSWPEKARAVTIRDQETYDLAGNLRKDIAVLEKQIVDHHKPIKQATDAAHKAAVAAEKRLLDPIKEAKDILGRGMGSFEDEQARIKRENDRRAEEAARKIEEEMRLQAAIAAEEMGADSAAVEEVLHTPVPIVIPTTAPTFDRFKGTHIQDRWHAEVTDIKALCRAVADGKLPATYVEANMTALNNRARNEKNLMNVPGVRAVCERR